MTGAKRPLLEVRDMSAGYYAGHDVVHHIDLEVAEGEIVCVIGPNGAGKSTVFKAIYGLAEVRSGRVLCDGLDITNIAPQDALRTARMAMVPQLRSVFPQMTVHENLELGMYLEPDKARVRERIDYVYGLFPRLARRSRQDAGTMSGRGAAHARDRPLPDARAPHRPDGRTLGGSGPDRHPPGLLGHPATEPRDRPDRPDDRADARQGLEASHRGYVLEMGRNSHQGPARELLADPEVRRAFLGLR